MKSYINFAGISLFILLFCSCHSYIPYLNDQQISSEVLREKIEVGKKYEVLTKDHKKMIMKVESLTEDKMIGEARVSVDGNTFQVKNQIILFDQIASVRNQKVNAIKTIAAIVIPIGIIAFIIYSASPIADL
jgi:hypothetical protein